jgi:poly(A) polymerase Pap1
LQLGCKSKGGSSIVQKISPFFTKKRAIENWIQRLCGFENGVKNFGGTGEFMTFALFVERITQISRILLNEAIHAYTDHHI